MPAPSFGFSAGDFVDAVNVFTDVCKALTDAGGAAEDYRQTVCQLELLEKSIHQLLTEHLIPTFTQGAQESLVECARKQADMTLQTLQEGLKAISKFEAKLGTQAKAGFFRGAGRKAQWATMQTKDVEKLRAKLGTQLQNLNSLLHALTAYVPRIFSI